jgi:hypothetical protein
LLYCYYVLLLLYLYLDVGGMVVCLQPRRPCASGAAVMRMLLLPLHPRPRRRRNGGVVATSSSTPAGWCRRRNPGVAYCADSSAAITVS